MDFLTNILDFVLHIDEYLGEIVRTYGLWANAILFLIIFCETGLVVTPFLPGDSLLFAAGALSAQYPDELNIWVLLVILIIAAIAGDALNYLIGSKLGERLMSKPRPFLKQEYIDRTHAFYEKHGGKTIILARFVPIVRTFAPFVAGMGQMTYRKFFTYNVVGGIVWVTLFLFAGNFFGNIPVIRENFELVALGIVIVSILPMVIEYLRHRGRQKAEGAAQADVLR